MVMEDTMGHIWTSEKQEVSPLLPTQVHMKTTKATLIGAHILEVHGPTHPNMQIISSWSMNNMWAGCVYGPLPGQVAYSHKHVIHTAEYPAMAVQSQAASTEWLFPRCCCRAELGWTNSDSSLPCWIQVFWQGLCPLLSQIWPYNCDINDIICYLFKILNWLWSCHFQYHQERQSLLPLVKHFLLQEKIV